MHNARSHLVRTMTLRKHRTRRASRTSKRERTESNFPSYYRVPPSSATGYLLARISKCPGRHGTRDLGPRGMGGWPGCVAVQPTPARYGRRCTFLEWPGLGTTCRDARCPPLGSLHPRGRRFATTWSMMVPCIVSTLDNASLQGVPGNAQVDSQNRMNASTALLPRATSDWSPPQPSPPTTTTLAEPPTDLPNSKQTRACSSHRQLSRPSRPRSGLDAALRAYRP